MRRNDVVWLKEEPGVYWSFYGRVIRIIDDKALWICTGKHIHLTPIDKLEVVDYVGKWEYAPDGIVKYFKRDADGFIIFSANSIRYQRKPRFEYMPSLRKLKQYASHFHGRNVWKTPLDYEYLCLED